MGARPGAPEAAAEFDEVLAYVLGTVGPAADDAAADGDASDELGLAEPSAASGPSERPALFEPSEPTVSESEPTVSGSEPSAASDPETSGPSETSEPSEPQPAIGSY
jgi:hypothetical protein